MKKEVFLKRVPLFSGLTPVDLSRLAQIAQAREAKKGETIFTQSSSGDVLYIVVQGLVKIFGRSSTGRSKTFAYLNPRDFFGEMALLAPEGRSASAKALEPSVLLTLRRRDFQDLLKRRPGMYPALLRTLCDRLRRADREIEAISFNSVVGRVAKVLADLSHRQGQPSGNEVRLSMALSHQELADRVGTAREMVSRVLQRFTRTGCLRMEGKTFVLTDINKLRGWIL